MEDLLQEILESFGYPVYLQGSLSEDDAYPDSFFTFWNADSESEDFFDNTPFSTVYTYRIYFYSCDAALLYSKFREAVNTLREAGFTISGDGFSVASDEPSHDGRGVIAYYKKYKGE